MASSIGAFPQQSGSAWGAQSFPNGTTAPFGYRPSYSAPQYFQPAYQPQYNMGYGGFGGYGGYGGFGNYGGYGGFNPGGQQYMQQGLLGMAPRGNVAAPYDRAPGMMAEDEMMRGVRPAPYQQQDNLAKNIYTLYAPFQQSGAREAQQAMAQQVASGTGDANQMNRVNFAKAMNTMYAGSPPVWAQQPMQYGPNFFPQPQTVVQSFGPGVDN